MLRCLYGLVSSVKKRQGFLWGALCTSRSSLRERAYASECSAAHWMHSLPPGMTREAACTRAGFRLVFFRRGWSDCGMSPILTDLGRLVVGTLQVSWLCWSDTWIAQMPC